MIQKEFIPYEEALALKELGFDDPCFTHYLNSVLLKNSLVVNKREINSCFDQIRVAAPLYQQAFRWFRENFSVFVSPNVISYSDGPRLWFFELNSSVLSFGTDLGETDDYVRFEEAELAALRKLIKIAKDQK